MMTQEYLVSYGRNGDFGRFRAPQPVALRRGVATVVHTHRGLELGTVLKSAPPTVAAFLPNTTVGALVRSATRADFENAERARQRAEQLRQRAVELAQTKGLPLEVLDAEVLLDGARGILHLMRWADFDARPFVSALSSQGGLQIELLDLTAPEPAPEDEHGGCGSCGSHGGGCGSCGSGGGCGSCGSTADAPDAVGAFFAGQRDRADRRQPLL